FYFTALLYYCLFSSFLFLFFSFNNTSPTDIYTLSLHDALPICSCLIRASRSPMLSVMLLSSLSQKDNRWEEGSQEVIFPLENLPDRKSTRLNSSHDQISYAVFCLKKKKKKKIK